MKNMVYLNGEMMPQTEAKISVFDAGFLYGYGAFETMRAYNSIIFRLERHLQRLGKAAELLGIAGYLEIGDIEHACYKLLEKNNLKEARIRLAVTAGETGVPPAPEPSNITVFIITQELVPGSGQIYINGCKAVTSDFRRYSKSKLTGLKTSCYLENLLARREALRQKTDEALLLNERGLVTEGTVSNIFILGVDSLLTPPVKNGALPGITREVVMELCKQMGIKCREGQITVTELAAAREAFLTNSVIEIMPLVNIDSKPVGIGRPGPMTKRLIRAYREIVGNETNCKPFGNA